MHWQDVASDLCSDEGQEQFQSHWRIDGRIEADEQQISIEPELSQLALHIPLLAYRGTSATFRDDQEEYYDLITRGVSAIINQYPADLVEIASRFREGELSVQAEQGLRFLGGNTPYLALRFLQRAATGNPGLYYELGTALQNLSAPRQAENAFRMAIASNPDHGQARRDLGTILFNQGKYEEAAKEFELAGITSGVAEKYAQLLYLQGRRAEAREQATSAITRGERSTDLQLLLARLDIGENKLGDAVDRLSSHLAENQADRDRDRTVKLVKEAAATALTRGDLVTSEKALDTLLERAPDPEVYLVRGRVAVAKSERNDFSGTEQAVGFFTKALTTKKDKNPENPELDLVALELAEALFLDGQYAQAAWRANNFFSAEYSSKGHEEPSPDTIVSTHRYKPVAGVLLLSGQHLTRSTPIENAIQMLDSWLGKAPKRPELIVWVAGANGREPVTVSRWSFATFRRYVCTHIRGKKRSEIAQLIDRVEGETGMDKTACPTR